MFSARDWHASTRQNTTLTLDFNIKYQTSAYVYTYSWVCILNEI